MTKTTGDLITADDWNNLAVVPTGAIVAWPLASAPSGWLLCAGQEVSRTTYADLFAAIGTTYGVGDSGTTFNLPDLRGRFPLGKDNMGGTSADRVTNAAADAIGGADGAETHALSVSEMPAHNHTERAPDTTGKLSTVTDCVVAESSTGTQSSFSTLQKLLDEWADTSFTASTPLTTANTGGNGAHNNMPPYLAMNYVIKV